MWQAQIAIGNYYKDLFVPKLKLELYLKSEYIDK